MELIGDAEQLIHVHVAEPEAVVGVLVTGRIDAARRRAAGTNRQRGGEHDQRRHRDPENSPHPPPPSVVSRPPIGGHAPTLPRSPSPFSACCACVAACALGKRRRVVGQAAPAPTSKQRARWCFHAQQQQYPKGNPVANPVRTVEGREPQTSAAAIKTAHVGGAERVHPQIVHGPRRRIAARRRTENRPAAAACRAHAAGPGGPPQAPPDRHPTARGATRGPGAPSHDPAGRRAWCPTASPSRVRAGPVASPARPRRRLRPPQPKPATAHTRRSRRRGSQRRRRGWPAPTPPRGQDRHPRASR